MKNLAALALLIAGLFCVPLQAQNWPQWRGPNLNGSSDAKDLPDKLDASTQRWSTQLPGPGAGTPVIWQDRIFISCLDSQSKKLLGMCLSREDGKILWSRQIGLGFKQNGMNNTASPSAVTDGKMVWFYFGTGDLAAFDLDGSEKWSRNIQKDFGPFNILWIYASSPLLYDGKLYIQVLQRDVPVDGRSSTNSAESYLLAINPQTGADIFRQVRPSEAAVESKESYTTPLPCEHDGHAEILLVGGDCVTAHDPQTGKELWRCGGWNPQKINHWRMVAGLVAGDGLIFTCTPKGQPIFAIKDGGSGDVTATHVAWKNPQLSSDVCVPLLYQNHLFVLNGDQKDFYCADPQTGKILWQGHLGGNAVFRASPTGADGKIYCMNEAGDVWVLATDQFKILSHSSLGGQRSRASIAAAQGAVFVRAGDKLFCFGKS